MLKEDHTYGHIQDLKECPSALIKRIKHYFMTYKNDPDTPDNLVQITDEYGQAEALQIMKASRLDYLHHFENIRTK